MKIQVRTTEPTFVQSFFEQENVVRGDKIAIGNTGAEITYADFPKKGAFGLSETVTMILTFVSGVASQVVANWIYEKLIGKAQSLKIERIEVKIDRDEIRNAIERIAKERESEERHKSKE